MIAEDGKWSMVRNAERKNNRKLRNRHLPIKHVEYLVIMQTKHVVFFRIGATRAQAPIHIFVSHCSLFESGASTHDT